MTQNRTISRRTFLRFGGTVVGMAALAACAPGAPPQAAGPAAAEAPPSAEPVTIRYGRHDPAAGVAVTVDAFHEENSGIKVEVEQIGEFHAKVRYCARGALPARVQQCGPVEIMAGAMHGDGEARRLAVAG